MTDRTGTEDELHRRAIGVAPEQLTFGGDFGQLASPVHWPSLTDPERRHRTDQLTEWVTQLVDRFALDARTVPPCWAQHNNMVETLSALRDHERGCYNDAAPPTAAIDFLRALQLVETHLRDLTSRTPCTGQEHRPGAAWTPRPF